MDDKLTIIGFARLLRKEQTEAENILWNMLRNRKLAGYKFRRQHPLAKKYIADFYCSAKQLIVEVDGRIHTMKEVKANDKDREINLLSMGFYIIRFSNEEVFSDTNEVLRKIKAKLEEL